MDDQPVITTTWDGAVATVTIDRPAALNALSRRVLEELAAAFDALAGAGTALRGVVLVGAGGRAFVAGADIRELSDLDAEGAAAMGRLGHDAVARIESLGAPVIACVDGYALGGGLELALACDFVYASAQSRFGLPEVSLGVIPGFGGTVRLPRAVGLARAKELIYSGRMVDAAEAERIGLVSRVESDRDALLAAARATLDEIGTRSPSAVALAKRVLVDASGTPTERATELEIGGFSRAFGTEDMREGTSAFLDKRTPEFTGR
ncbi:enoyl-CoA hydratase/isomerase family protein [Agromyces mangrovi Wang et al. 2018]|uniref:enoyl-CoA hydratase/isomerase family protein n=1 Tax=Agromyces mangrovi TaxID=1858653 RepID=UPI002572D223|nr:enoyl-CoA hydratase-related protein [Agromyces mangrovi]BDZ63417.1 crotonase [Agromyces mangrovi]